MEENMDNIDSKLRCEKKIKEMFESTRDKILSNTHKYEFWLEEVRTLDLLMAAGRMRGWRWRQND